MGSRKSFRLSIHRSPSPTINTHGHLSSTHTQHTESLQDSTHKHTNSIWHYRLLHTQRHRPKTRMPPIPPTLLTFHSTFTCTTQQNSELTLPKVPDTNRPQDTTHTRPTQHTKNIQTHKDLQTTSALYPRHTNMYNE